MQRWRQQCYLPRCGASCALLLIVLFAASSVAAAAPTISSLSPTSGPVGTLVTIAGSGFGSSQGSSTVTFNGTTAAPTSWSATSIKVPVPTGATTGNVVVKVSGSTSNKVAFTVVAAPSISSLSPTSGTAGTSVTISGSNFGSSQGSSTVSFNGTVATPTSWGSSTLRVPVPASATTGNVVVTVGGVASNGVKFTVAATPTISSLSPTSGAVGAVVTISGTNFGATQGSSTVRFNGTTAAPTSWSATSIKAPVPSGASTGNVVVTVAGVASSGVSFTVLPTPSISGLSPASGAVGTAVTVSGSNFGSSQGSSTVTFNGTIGTPTRWRSSSITVPVPTGATTGNVIVTVNGVASNGVSFTVPSTAPAISSLSPTSGPVGAAVTISGTNFGASQGTSTVSFNGAAATPTSWSATSINVSVPAAATTGNVVVTVNGVPSTGASFTVLPTPSIASLSPTSAAVGAAVTIAGTNFGASQGTSTVTFNGVAATTVTSWSSGTIVVTVPAAATTGNVVVTVNGVPSTGASFTVLPTPSIASLSPTSAAVGTAVTITGTNFGASQGTSTVTFNGAAATTVTSWSSGTIVVTVPAAATTGNVVVTVNGVPSTGASFTVLPTILVSPASITIPLGTAQQFHATAVYSDGSSQDVTSAATWSSLSGNIAGINAVGLATSLATGPDTITATFQSASGIATLNVGPPALVSIAVSPGVSSMTVGNAQQFTATGSYSDGSAQDVTAVSTWAASNPGVASFSASGLAMALSAGNSLITATSGSVNGTATLIVNPGTTAASLNTSRYLHSATTLNNGQILMAGGVSCPAADFCTYLNSAELYDPVAATFTNTGSLAAARSAPALLLANGKVLVAGGYACDASGNCQSLSSVEIYDPSSGSFSSAGTMTAPRSGHTLTLLNNGQVLIAGGQTCTSATTCTALNTAEIYDPIAATFTPTSNPMNAARYGASAVALNQGLVLIAGGFDGANLPAAAEIYDPVAGTFAASGPSLNFPRFGATSTLLNNGQVLLAGGSTCPLPGCPVNSAELYDPVANAFNIAGGNANNTLTVPRFNHSSTLLTNGQVFVAGGYSSCMPSSSCTVESSTELFDPTSGTFSSSQILTAALAGHSGTLLSNGTVLLAGGINAGVTLAPDEWYQPVTLTPPGLVSIVLTPAALSLDSGQTQQVAALGTFSDGTTQTLQSVIWNATNTGVAGVSNSPGSAGIVNAVSAGSATLVAAAGNVGGSATLTVAALVSLTISPSTPSAVIATNVPFTATATYSDGSTSNLTQTVTWAVNGMPGGNSTVGTISSSGVYAAPLTVPSPATVTVSALSLANPSLPASAQLTVIPEIPVSISLSPPSANLDGGCTAQFTATVQNTGNTAVTWQVNGITGGSAATGTISAWGSYTAPATVASLTVVTVTAISQADPTQWASAQVTIYPVAIQISPNSVNLPAGFPEQFTAMVQNTGNTAVTWQVNGVTGGSAATGTISSAGLYSAPMAVSNPYTVTITAISQADPTMLASASATINPAFYVANGGSDTNPGTIAAPWQTIQHAASTVAAGSTAYVRAGTYNESVNIAVSGSAAAGPVTFQSYPGETAIVDGTGLTPSTSKVQGLFNIVNQSYVTVQGFEISNYTTASGSAAPAGIWVTGSGSNIQLLNNVVHNITTTSEKNGNAFGIAVYGSAAPASLDSVTISGNQVYSLKTGNSESVTVDGNVTNFVISNNIIHDNDNIGIDAIGFEGVAPNPAYDYARNGLISGNTVYNISAINNPGEGNQYSADGIYCDGCSQVIIERNLVYNCDLNIEAASEHSGHVSSFVTIRNNLVYNANSVGISIGGYSSKVGGSDHITIVNNTLFENDTKNTGSGELQVQYYATNNVFENNIVYATSQGLFINNRTSSEPSPVAANYNLYFSSLSAAAARFVWNGTRNAGFTAYQSASGEDSNSLYQDPLFLSLTTPDLPVQAASPAVSAGTNLGAVVEGTLDFAGNARVQGSNIDIGAYEQ